MPWRSASSRPSSVQSLSGPRPPSRSQSSSHQSVRGSRSATPLSRAATPVVASHSASQQFYDPLADVHLASYFQRPAQRKQLHEVAVREALAAADSNPWQRTLRYLDPASTPTKHIDSPLERLFRERRRQILMGDARNPLDYIMSVVGDVAPSRAAPTPDVAVPHAPQTPMPPADVDHEGYGGSRPRSSCSVRQAHYAASGSRPSSSLGAASSRVATPGADEMRCGAVPRSRSERQSAVNEAPVGGAGGLKRRKRRTKSKSTRESRRASPAAPQSRRHVTFKSPSPLRAVKHKSLIVDDAPITLDDVMAERLRIATELDEIDGADAASFTPVAPPTRVLTTDEEDVAVARGDARRKKERSSVLKPTGRQHRAATTIQAWFIGCMVRRELRSHHAAAIALQRWYRELLRRRAVAVAAWILQRAGRGWRGRTRLAVVSEQKAVLRRERAERALVQMRLLQGHMQLAQHATATAHLLHLEPGERRCIAMDEADGFHRVVKEMIADAEAVHRRCFEDGALREVRVIIESVPRVAALLMAQRVLLEVEELEAAELVKQEAATRSVVGLECAMSSLRSGLEPSSRAAIEVACIGGYLRALDQLAYAFHIDIQLDATRTREEFCRIFFVALEGSERRVVRQSHARTSLQLNEATGRAFVLECWRAALHSCIAQMPVELQARAARPDSGVQHDNADIEAEERRARAAIETTQAAESDIWSGAAQALTRHHVQHLQRAAALIEYEAKCRGDIAAAESYELDILCVKVEKTNAVAAAGAMASSARKTPRRVHSWHRSEQPTVPEPCFEADAAAKWAASLRGSFRVDDHQPYTSGDSPSRRSQQASAGRSPAISDEHRRALLRISSDQNRERERIARQMTMDANSLLLEFPAEIRVAYSAAAEFVEMLRRRRHDLWLVELAWLRGREAVAQDEADAFGGIVAAAVMQSIELSESLILAAERGLPHEPLSALLLESEY